MNVLNGGMGNNSPITLHYTEEIIGLDRRLTVVGTVCDKMGDLRLESISKNKVIVSTKSADDMADEAKKNMESAKKRMTICGAIGGACTVLGIILAIL